MAKFVDWAMKEAPARDLAARSAAVEKEWLKKNKLSKIGAKIFKRKKRSPGYWARRRRKGMA
jgi:hypothetical protein